MIAACRSDNILHLEAAGRRMRPRAVRHMFTPAPSVSWPLAPFVSVRVATSSFFLFQNLDYVLYWWVIILMISVFSAYFPLLWLTDNLGLKNYEPTKRGSYLTALLRFPALCYVTEILPSHWLVFLAVRGCDWMICYIVTSTRKRGMFTNKGVAM